MMPDCTGSQLTDIRRGTEWETEWSTRGAVQNTPRFCNILRSRVVKKRVVVIKLTSKEWCSNCFGNWKRKITSNTANGVSTLEAAASCQRNTFSSIKIITKCNITFTYSMLRCEVMRNDASREDTSRFDLVDIV